MHHVVPNPGNLSPRGFRPRVPDPHRVVTVSADAVWGQSDVQGLRTAALVRLSPPAQDVAPSTPGVDDAVPSATGSRLGEDLTDEQLVARACLALSLGGVPVAGGSLAEGPRALLDPELVGLLDKVTPASAADPQRREQLALALRRRAWSLVGYPRTQAPVVVLLPPDPPAQLLADLDAQTWAEQVRLTAGADESLAVAEAVRQGALYCCRPQAGVRYAPEHLADLVHGLRHSGAAVAHSPARFWPWQGGLWLEDDSVVERPAATGLDGGSLWYAADGPHPPDGQGYAVHGLNAVPLPGRAGQDAPAAAWRLHTGLPTLLSWLSGPAGGGAVSVDTPPAPYLATTS